MVIAAFSERLFYTLTSVTNTNPIPYLYFKEPTKYGKYLRQVMMAWIIDDHISVNNIIPLEYLGNIDGLNEPASDSDDDFEVATVVPSSLTSDTASVVEKSADDRFHCSLCTLSYTRRTDLNRHMKKSHQQSIYTGDSICLQCDFRAVHVDKLCEHSSKAHIIEMELDRLTFPSYEDFEEWKYDLEDKTKCS